MLPENTDFFVRGDDGEEYGPVDLEELRNWVQENRAGLGTEVRRDDPGATWQAWQNYPELVALLAEVQGTGPVPAGPGVAPAPLGKRFLAFAMDLILSGLLSFPILFTLALLCLPDWCVQSALASLSVPPGPQPDLPADARILGSLISDVILGCYMGGFHAVHGFTPGKALMHLRVVDQTGQKPTPTRSFLRALVLIVSMGLLFIPFAYVFLNPQRRAFHDMIADTYVVES
jgi:uncharacterized RDD family membrane protein YckC